MTPARCRLNAGWYSGGDVKNATYSNHGTHAEAIEITFDPSQTSFRDLLEFFFQIHDPTTPNRQGNDRGQATDRRFSTRARNTPRRRRHHRRRRGLRAVAGQGGDRAFARWRFLGGRARAPGLPGTLSERLHLPLRPPPLGACTRTPPEDRGVRASVCRRWWHHSSLLRFRETRGFDARVLAHERVAANFRKSVGQRSASYNGRIHVQPVRAAGRFLRHTAGPLRASYQQFFPGAHALANRGTPAGGARLASRTVGETKGETR